MPKRMTVVFDDEGLYTALKVEAVRRGCYAKDIVIEAVREWLDAREDQDARDGLEDARVEWKREGGEEARKFFRDLDQER